MAVNTVEKSHWIDINAGGALAFPKPNISDLTATPTPVHNRAKLGRLPATAQSHDNANGYAAPLPS